MNVRLHEAISEIRRLQQSEATLRHHVESMQTQLLVSNPFICMSRGTCNVVMVPLHSNQTRSTASCVSNMSPSPNQKRPHPGSSSSGGGLLTLSWELSGLREARNLRTLPGWDHLLYSSRDAQGLHIVSKVW